MGTVASDIMSRDVICVQEDADLRDLAKLFLEKGITGAPVNDAEGDLVGVISQTDLLYYHLTRDDELVLSSDFYSSVRVEGRPLPSGFQIEDVNTGCVSDVMTPVVHAVHTQTGVEEIARIMTENHIHRVIVRRGRKAVGIISALDVLQAVAREERKAGAASRTKPAAKRRAAAPGKAASRSRSAKKKASRKPPK